MSRVRLHKQLLMRIPQPHGLVRTGARTVLTGPVKPNRIHSPSVGLERLGWSRRPPALTHKDEAVVNPSAPLLPSTSTKPHRGARD